MTRWLNVWKVNPLAIPLPSSIAETMDILFPPANRFNCARLYRGEYITGTNEDEHRVYHDFRILSGEAEIRRGRPVLVSCSTSEGGSSVLDTFYIFPTSQIVRVRVHDERGKHRIVLFQEEDRSDSRMFKQRPTERMLGFAD